MSFLFKTSNQIFSIRSLIIDVFINDIEISLIDRNQNFFVFLKTLVWFGSVCNLISLILTSNAKILFGFESNVNPVTPKFYYLFRVFLKYVLDILYLAFY